MDVGLGLLAALILILATPGLAITAVVALLVLVLCALSIVLERRVARRSGHGHASASPSPRATKPARR
jgi:hypothetical protein